MELRIKNYELRGVTVRNFLLAAVIVVCLVLLQERALAQEASDLAQNIKKYNIVFPIAELGGCTSVENCKAYCGEVENQQACLDFAKKKGLHRKEQKGLNKELAEKAKALLGCTSDQSCKEFCQQPENFEKCSLFAKENKLRGGIKHASGSAEFRRQMREGKEASQGGLPGPRSEKAYENANENARFCRENPERCANASGSGKLNESFKKKIEADKKKFELRIEREKKEFEMKGEKLKKEFERGEERKNKEMERDFKTIENEVENEIEDAKEEVQGVSTSPSVFEQIYRFFFK